MPGFNPWQRERLASGMETGKISLVALMDEFVVCNG